MDDRASQLVERIRSRLGTPAVSPHFLRLAKWDPDYLESYLTMVIEGTEAREGQLSRKVKELITLAVCAALMNWNGTRVHIRAALDNGASPREVLEALEAAVPPSGVPAVLYGSEVLEQVLQERGMEFC